MNEEMPCEARVDDDMDPRVQEARQALAEIAWLALEEERCLVLYPLGEYGYRVVTMAFGDYKAMKIGRP